MCDCARRPLLDPCLCLAHVYAPRDSLRSRRCCASREFDHGFRSPTAAGVSAVTSLRRAHSCISGAMSQQHYDYDYPLPPPPPSPRASGSTSPLTASLPHTPASAGYVPGATSGGRSRPVSAHLPVISTAFLSEQGALASNASTPVSGSHLSPHFLHAPRTPSALNPQSPGGLSPHRPGGLVPPPPGGPPRSPAVAMEPYNPRQWQNSRGQVSGSQMVFQQRHAVVGTTQVTGMEGLLSNFCSARLCPLYQRIKK